LAWIDAIGTKEQWIRASGHRGFPESADFSPKKTVLNLRGFASLEGTEHGAGASSPQQDQRPWLIRRLRGAVSLRNGDDLTDAQFLAAYLGARKMPLRCWCNGTGGWPAVSWE
jgi:hypothetical protein